jgi:hypothetical protein
MNEQLIGNLFAEAQRQMTGSSSKEFSEKFAELIVRECIDIADDYVKDYCVEEHIKFNHPRSKIGLKIKEHFGVENKENT